MKCNDHNNTPLNIGSWVTYIDPQSGKEEEGCIIACRENNTVVIEAESGNITTNGKNTYVHP